MLYLCNILAYICCRGTTYRLKKAKVNLPDDFGVPCFLALSPLQKEILKHVCTVPEATYSTLTQGLDGDRVTILQSLKSLVKYRYIEQKRLSPEHEKSKLIFIPTFKGFSEVWPSVNAKDITNTRKDNEITRYVKFVDQVFSSSQQIEMLRFLFDRLADGYLTDICRS